MIPPARRSRRLSPPALVDDAMSEIFLRLPPDNPRSLVRAAAVCKNFRRILSDAAFARDYCKFHGAPPGMLGFLHNSYYVEHCISHFVSTSSSTPSRCRNHNHLDWLALDSRHGRVLFWTPKALAVEFVVSDPMANTTWKVPPNPRYSAGLFNPDRDDEFNLTWNATLLGSNNCRGGHFILVLVGSEDEEEIMFAAVYSSESGEWRETIVTGQANAISQGVDVVLMGDKVYFPCETSNIVVEYDVGDHKLSVIHTPYKGGRDLVLTAAKDGMLLFTGVWESKLHIWSMEPGPNGDEAWAGRRALELEPLVSSRTVSEVFIVGVVEGASVVVFLRTEDGLFTTDLNSGRSKKVSEKKPTGKIIAITSFYPGGTNWHHIYFFICTPFQCFCLQLRSLKSLCLRDPNSTCYFKG
jgi:hypothetical protein